MILCTAAASTTSRHTTPRLRKGSCCRRETHQRRGGRIFVLFIDDLHMEFANTGRLRSW